MCLCYCNRRSLAHLPCFHCSIVATQARVSNGYKWIVDTVCQVSVDPPSHFHCNKVMKTPPAALLTNNDTLLEEPSLYLLANEDYLTALGNPVLVMKQEHFMVALFLLCGIALVVGVAMKRALYRSRRELPQTFTTHNAVDPPHRMYGSTD